MGPSSDLAVETEARMHHCPLLVSSRLASKPRPPNYVHKKLILEKFWEFCMKTISKDEPVSLTMPLRVNHMPLRSS